MMKTYNKILPLATLLPLSFISCQALAGGFQLAEYSATGLGRAYSGEAAIADNAGSQWRNPALLTYLEGTQVSIGAINVDPNVDISGSGREGIIGAGGQNYTTSSNDYIEGAIIPNAYASYQINDAWTLGFAAGINFGLKSELGTGFQGSILGDQGELEAKEFVLSAGYKATERVRLGLGVRYVVANGHFGASTGTSALGPAANTIYRYVEGDTNEWGWQVGLTWQINDDNRIGLAYKSEVKLGLEGSYTSGMSLPTNSSAKLDLTLPATAELAYYHQMNKDLLLSASLNWTDWSVFEELNTQISTGTVSLGEQNWRDNYRFGLGAEYQLNPDWKLRTGLAYDRAAVADEHRTATIPEVDRYWVTLGAGYQISEQLTIDGGFAYIFSKEGTISESQTLASLTATTEGYIWAAGIQVSYAF